MTPQARLQPQQWQQQLRRPRGGRAGLRGDRRRRVVARLVAWPVGGRV